jgi:hypothetical protein
MPLIPDSRMHAISRGEAVDQPMLMHPDTCDEIRRHTNIQGPVAATGQKIHTRLLHTGPSLDAGFRRHDDLFHPH